MRIVQLIDSLEAGGAERMAVNYANALHEEVGYAALVATRKEGPLKQQIHAGVDYLFLNKQKSWDLKALLLLRRFVKQQHIQYIHAHSTSFFLAVLLKLSLPQLKIIWHDHNGNRVNTSKKDNRIIVFCSLFFYVSLAVNEELELWSKKHLRVKKNTYFPNFVALNSNYDQKITTLKGISGKRMVHLANLRAPKNHIGFLKAFLQSNARSQNWSLHLVGADKKDAYSSQIKEFIQENKLEEHVYIYGACSDIDYILSQASIGVLSSTYEGFPVTLLEYGKAKLSLLTTKVGYCGQLVDHNVSGLLFDPLNEKEIVDTINQYINNDRLRQETALHFYNFVKENYSDKVIIRNYLSFLLN